MVWVIIKYVGLFILVVTCVRLYHYSLSLKNFVLYEISEELAEKLLSITTDGNKKIPYFSNEDQSRIKEKWRKEGYLK